MPEKLCACAVQPYAQPCAYLQIFSLLFSSDFHTCIRGLVWLSMLFSILIFRDQIDLKLIIPLSRPPDGELDYWCVPSCSLLNS